LLAQDMTYAQSDSNQGVAPAARKKGIITQDEAARDPEGSCGEARGRRRHLDGHAPRHRSRRCSRWRVHPQGCPATAAPPRRELRWRPAATSAAVVQDRRPPTSPLRVHGLHGSLPEREHGSAIGSSFGSVLTPTDPRGSFRRPSSARKTRASASGSTRRLATYEGPRLRRDGLLRQRCREPLRDEQRGHPPHAELLRRPEERALGIPRRPGLEHADAEPRGLSPIPSDVFYSNDMDTNYQAGLTWARQPQVRLVFHATDEFALASRLRIPISTSGARSSSRRHSPPPRSTQPPPHPAGHFPGRHRQGDLRHEGDQRPPGTSRWRASSVPTRSTPIPRRSIRTPRRRAGVFPAPWTLSSSRALTSSARAFTATAAAATSRAWPRLHHQGARFVPGPTASGL
jgi:hypothetical protein